MKSSAETNAKTLSELNEPKSRYHFNPYSVFQFFFFDSPEWNPKPKPEQKTQKKMRRKNKNAAAAGDGDHLPKAMPDPQPDVHTL